MSLSALTSTLHFLTGQTPSNFEPAAERNTWLYLHPERLGEDDKERLNDLHEELMQHQALAEPFDEHDASTSIRTLEVSAHLFDRMNEKFYPSKDIQTAVGLCEQLHPIVALRLLATGPNNPTKAPSPTYLDGLKDETLKQALISHFANKLPIKLVEYLKGLDKNLTQSLTAYLNPKVAFVGRYRTQWGTSQSNGYDREKN